MSSDERRDESVLGAQIDDPDDSSSEPHFESEGSEDEADVDSDWAFVGPEDSDGEEVANENLPSDAEDLINAVAKLSEFLCVEEFVNGRAASTFVVYFSGLLSFPYPGTSFTRPRNYTSKLSGLIYCIRLCLLNAAFPYSGPRTQDLRRLNRLRERFMCLGSQAPMGELLSLRSYGRALSRSDGPSFRVNWSADGETVSWDAGMEGVGKLTMLDFRTLGRRAVANSSASLTTLLYGWSPPKLTLDNIRDTLSNQEYGYSFVRDPANWLSSAYLELSSRACLDSVDGLMKKGGWNMAARPSISRRRSASSDPPYAGLFSSGGPGVQKHRALQP